MDGKGLARRESLGDWIPKLRVNASHDPLSPLQGWCYEWLGSWTWAAVVQVFCRLQFHLIPRCSGMSNSLISRKRHRSCVSAKRMLSRDSHAPACKWEMRWHLGSGPRWIKPRHQSPQNTAQ